MRRGCERARDGSKTLHIYAKNIGAGVVKLDPNALYVNDAPTAFTPVPTGTDIPEGATWEILIDEDDLPGEINGKTSTIKIVAVGGTFASVSTARANVLDEYASLEMVSQAALKASMVLVRFSLCSWVGWSLAFAVRSIGYC